jgi:hypothetical protein
VTKPAAQPSRVHAKEPPDGRHRPLPRRPAPRGHHRLGVRRPVRREGAAPADVDVTVISKTAYHLFQPLLYQVATGILSEGEVAPATREILRRQRNTTVLLARSPPSTWTRARVTFTTPVLTKTIAYDSLIVTAGAGQSYFGNDEFADYAPGMKSIDDALELRGRIFGAFEIAELQDDPAKAAEWTDVRRRRRRRDRRGDGRADRRARPRHAASATTGGSTPRRRA